MKQKHPTGPSLKASPVVKRSIKIAGHQTSVSLEDEFWNALKEIAASKDTPLPSLVSTIDKERQYGNLSSTIRVYVLSYYSPPMSRAQALLDWPSGAPMHEFKIGQSVFYVPRRAEGRYVVMRLLPQAKGELRYIIRSQDEPGREYVAEASELRRVPGGR
jgi:predicted DNA-binding ribbon-helix-helix protein